METYIRQHLPHRLPELQLRMALAAGDEGKLAQIASDIGYTKASYTCRNVLCGVDAFYGSKFALAHCRAHKLPHETYMREAWCAQCGRVNLVDANRLCEACNPVDFERA